MLTRALQVIEEAVNAKRLPGAVLRVDVGGKPVHVSAHGVTRYDIPQKVESNTWFDLASVTKILATVPATMLLMQDNRINIEAPIGIYLPEINESLASIPFAYFLSHTSGLPDWHPFYDRIPLMSRNSLEAKMAIRQMHMEKKIVYKPGSKQVYSDIGMALVGFAIEAVVGKNLELFVEEHLLQPIADGDLAYLQMQPKSDIEIAATEDCPWRKKILVGEVHDDNTWTAGGCLGQAGLFGTVHGVAEMMDEFRKALIGESNIFLPTTVQSFMKKPTVEGHVCFRYGFDSPSAIGSSTGRYFGMQTFGHLGFTGCSAWCDPNRKLTVVFLSNRVHPTRENDILVSLRPQLHDAIIEELVS